MSQLKGFVRVEYLDGLRGLAALLVVFTHYVQAFAPGVFTPDTSVDHGLEKLIASTPLNLLFHGHFWVAVFFVLSGYVLSLPGIRDPSSKWAFSSALKRYPRLAIPALASAVFAWVVGSITHARHLTAITPVTFTYMPNSYADVGPLLDAMIQGGFGAFFLGQNIINPVLWTIGIELFGSLMVIGLVWIFPDFKRRLIACGAIVVLMAGQNWWPAFAMGIIAAELTTRYQLPENVRKVASGIFLAAAVWLGSYPYFGADKGIWQYLPEVPAGSFTFYSSTGAFLLVVAVCLSRSAQSVLGSRPFAYLGSLSYSLYLVHFPLILCGAAFFVLHSLRFFSYWGALMIAFLPSMLVIWVSAEVFKRAVDAPSIQLSRRVGKVATAVFVSLTRKSVVRDI